MTADRPTLTLAAARRRLRQYFAPPTIPACDRLAPELRRFASARPATVSRNAWAISYISPPPPEVAEAIRRIAAWASRRAGDTYVLTALRNYRPETY